MADREIVRVEKDEQINGLVRRLRQSGARDLTFVVAEEAPVLRNPVNLRLLRFYADEEQKRVRLVTGDAVVQRLADEAGVEWSLPEPEEGRTETSRAPAAAQGTPEAPREKGSLAAFAQRPRWSHLWAIPALILLIALVQLWAGPAATVTVLPALEPRTREVSVRGRTASPKGRGEILLVSLQSPVTASATAPATGRRAVGISRARGTVTFLNQDAQAVKVPAGTLVTTAAGTAFRVQETVQVPGVKTEYFMKIAVGLRAGQAEARVEAVEPGSGGNVAAGRVVKIQAQLSGRLQVTNPEPLRGGDDRIAPVVTAADIGRAEREAAAALARKAQASLEAQLPKGASLITESIRLSPPAVNPKLEPGSEAEEVSATAGANAFGLAYRPEAVREAAGELFAAETPEGYALLAESVSVGAPRLGRVEPQFAEFILQVSGQMVRKIDPAAVRRAVRGKSREQAEAAVKALAGVDGVRIEGARRRLPSWSGRLRVNIASPAGEAL